MSLRLTHHSRVRVVPRAGAQVVVAGLLAAAFAPVPLPAAAGAPTLPAHAGAPTTPTPTPHRWLADRAGVQGMLPAIRHARNDQYGASVAITGSTAIVGAPGVDKNRGAVYVFARTAAGWTLQKELTNPSGSAGVAFGSVVAISGTTIMVSAFLKGKGGTVYVYTRSAARWHRRAQLTEPGLDFGVAMALSGSTAVVGAPSASNAAGRGYVFRRLRTGRWSLQATLTDPRNTANDGFGSAVAVSGRTLAIGAPTGNIRPGRVYVYEFANSAWRLRAALASGRPGGDFFGLSVALGQLRSGVIAVIGAPGAGNSAGAAEIFAAVGRRFVRRARLTGQSLADFGYAVAASAGRVVIGAPLGRQNACGAAFEYTRQNGRWREREELVNAGCSVSFGWAVAVSGTTAIVGAPFARGSAGAAYIAPLL